MKKILVIYASAGDGHKKAAEAVYNAFSEIKDPAIKATLIDSLNYTNRFFKYCYKVGYMFLIKYLPTLWGFFYYILDNRFFYILSRPFRRAVNAFNTRRLISFILDEKFDLAVSTHFLGTEVICHLKNKGILSLPLVNIITDFKPHLFWQSEGVDYYVVGAESTKEALMARGVAEDRIKTLGIPIRKRFKRLLIREEVRKKLRLSPDKFTILVIGGGFGFGPIEKVVLELQGLDIDSQIIVVCGHNERLLNRLNSLKSQFMKPTRVFGFCMNIDEIMSGSDIMVSKVGGMAAAEALAKALPVLSVNPIPGQEMRNATFLFDNGVGFRIKRFAELNRVIQEFFLHPENLSQVKHHMQNLARPHAADDIAKLAVGMIK